MYDVIIVGGGASGMMAAAVAGESGKRILLIEKNKNLGEKLKITGGGRCNITNAEYDVHKFLAHYGKAAPFLYSPYSQFGVKETFRFFESHGLPLVVQARNRAFPHTERALDVYLTLEKILKKNNVTILTNSPITRISHKDNQINSVFVKSKEYKAAKYILATGGISHPETGSTGDGFGFLKNLGHTIIKPTPTIVPLKVPEKWVHSLAGVSLDFMKITFFVDDKRILTKKGKVLFTHFGLSGPLILNTASEVSGFLEGGKVTAIIDCFPDTDHGALDSRIIAVFDANKNKMLKNIFKNIAPEGMSEAILSLLPEMIDPNTKVHSITVPMRKHIVQLMKALPLSISGLMGYDRAVVSDGGVPLTEIDTKHMKSLIIENLYVTGDLLHINRPSGGYSLQLCWTTGYVAGKQI